jgi:hypothetical protein
LEKITQPPMAATRAATTTMSGTIGKRRIGSGGTVSGSHRVLD